VNDAHGNEWLNACYISYSQQKNFRVVRVFRVFRVVSSKSGIENIFLFSWRHLNFSSMP